MLIQQIPFRIPLDFSLINFNLLWLHKSFNLSLLLLMRFHFDPLLFNFELNIHRLLFHLRCLFLEIDDPFLGFLNLLIHGKLKLFDLVDSVNHVRPLLLCLL